jgi:stage V sporulation protein SpoVS
MPASRRRASARAALAFVAVALTLLAASNATQAATNPLSIVLKVGYSGFVKAQQWMPVTIDLTNNGQDVEGTLEVTAANGPAQSGQPIEAVIYQTQLSLPAGATKHLRTYLVEDSAPAVVSVRVVANGRVLASADSQPSTAATALIGVLSDQPAALDGFAAVHPGAIAANVVHLSLEDVGDSAMLLRAFDLLVIDDFATDTLTAAQRTAITDYVQNGGELLLGTGASWRKTLAGVSPAILPVQINGTTILSTATALGNLSRVEIATGALPAGAHAWLSEGNRPLLVERFVGGGSVTLATFDWNQDPIASWSGASVLLRQILVRTVFSTSSPNLGQGFAGPFGASGTSVTERSSALSQALGNLPALDLPSLVVIGLLVLAYVLLVGPINYLALRALHRGALAWVTVPLIAILASAGAFGTGVLTKGRSVQTNQVSIIHLEPGWASAYQESYTGILTPTRGDYNVSVAGAPLLIAPTGSYSGAINPDVIRVGADNSITLPAMIAYTLRAFATEGVVTAPQLSATATFANGKLQGTIRNLSSMPFTDAVVLAGDSHQILPTLAPGATATYEVTPKLTNNQVGVLDLMNIYPNSFYNTGGPQPTQSADANREAFEKTAILGLVSGSNYGFSPATAPMVVAWSKQPGQDITIAGSRPRATTETAVVLPLQVTAIGAGSLPAGMVLSRFTDIEGDAQQGMPGPVMTQNGTVTYDFTPNLAPGAHLSAASLDSTNSTPKGPVPGSSANLPAKVWDWLQSAWVPLTYNPSGVTPVPAAAINPSTGELRLQVAANGTQVVLGQVSLTGTVK